MESANTDQLPPKDSAGDSVWKRGGMLWAERGRDTEGQRHSMTDLLEKLKTKSCLAKVGERKELSSADLIFSQTQERQ